jgi:transposase
MVTRDGFPLIGTVDSGNKNDGVWNKEILSEFETSMLEYWKVVYVADSALVTTDNLRTMHEKGIRFISLLPSRYNLAQDLRDQAWAKGEWTYQGTFSEKKNAAKYWTQSMEADLGGKTYRFIVVRSSNLDKRKVKRLQNQLEKEKQELQKLKKSLDKEIFQCRPDAESRLREVISAHKMLHGLSGQVVEQRSVKRKPGRPKQGEEPEVHITYGIELDIHDPTKEALTEWRQKEATFVLITTESEEKMSDQEVLAEYKGQSSVEMRFSFLKDPLFVDGIFLKTPKRVEALGYVILLAVCVAAFLERRIRERLKEENTTIIAPGKRILNRPTIQVILDMLNEMNVAYLSDEEGTRRYLPDNTSKEIIKLVRLAGYDEQIYLRNT